MKRLSLLFFALIFSIFLFSAPVEAVIEIDAVYLTLQNDVDGNGYANFGDTVRIAAVATYTNPLTEAWLIPPFADCSNLGLGEYVMNMVNQPIGQYQVDVVLNEYVNTLNFANTSVTVRAQTIGGALPSEITNTMLVDLCQVAGQNPQVSPLLVPNGQDITIRIEDTRYQPAPYGGTKAWVNLIPIGGGGAVEVPYIGALPTPYFELELDASTQLYLTNREYTGALQITLKDPLHPAFVFVTNDFMLDTRPPQVDAAQTTVTVLSGNTTALAGDVLRLSAVVSQYDNETVTVRIPGLTAGANPVISADVAMPLISSSGEGNPALWQLDVNLSDADIKNSALLVVFTFTDDIGNVRTVERYIGVDLETPAFDILYANILQPFGANSQYDVGTTTCQLEIVASIPINVPPDTLTLNVDLTPIGGPAAQPMSMLFPYFFRYTYPIVAGATEDNQNLNFVVTAVDQAGNTVVQATTPAVHIDNISPTLTNITLTSADATVTTGQTFTITADATLIETGSVTVNLSSIGLATYSPLVYITGDTYSGTFTLPASGTGVPYVEGLRTFVVTARDTVISTGTNVIAHSVTATTPAKKFFNGDISVSAEVWFPDNTPSTYNVATTTCKIVVTADVPTLGFVDPLALTADFSSIGGPPTLAMPRVGATTQYRCIYEVPPGTTEDVVYNSFTVTINDKDGDRLALVDAVPTVAVDNVQPTFGNITVTSVQPTVISGESFTVTAEANLIEAGSLTIDLSSIGLGAFEPLNFVSGNLYSNTFVLQASSTIAPFTVPLVEGPRSFVITAHDTIATTTVGLVAHTVTANTPDHKFYNGNFTLTADVLYPDDADSPYDVATTSCKIVISAVVPVQGMITPLSASVDLSAIGGSPTQAMPRVGATDEYRTVYTIPAGTPALEDNLYHNFTVTILDKDSTQIFQRDTTPAIGIDNIQPTLSGITITAAQPTILAGMDFTITAQATQIEAGSVTVDLTPLGFSSEWSVATLTLQSGTTYSGTFTLPTLSVASAGLVVEGNKTLKVSANDTIATTTAAVIAHMVSDYTPTYKFFNRPYELNIRVLMPDNTPVVNDYATATCKLEIVASLTASTLLTPLNATVDLSSIGGPAALAMPKVAGLDNYRAVYTIPAGSLEDDTYYNFPVTILDKDGTQLLKDDTNPPIRIDSTLPVITSATLTNSDSIINVGDTFTITANVTGVELGSVSVDLSAIDMTYPIPTMVNLPETSPGVYSANFTLKDSITAGVICDADTSFKITVNDTIGNPYLDDAHYVSLNTNSMMIDNEPPYIAGIASNSYHNVNTDIDNGYVRIQDYLSFHADIASASQATGELTSITINMLPLGQPANTNMLASSSFPGWFDYVLPGGVPTGTINLVNTGFTVTAVDNANNATSTIIYIPIDNYPITVNGFDVDSSVYKAGRTDSAIGTINFNKIVSFNIPYSTFPIDHATGTIDLSAIGGPSNQLLASDSASYSYVIPTASTTYEALGHKFNAVLFDQAGNSTLAQSNSYTVDCQLPEILGATATVQAGTLPLAIGDRIRFSVLVKNHENVAPTIDLTTLGGSDKQALTATGGGNYAYIAEIGTGTWDGELASFSVTAWDNDQNYVSTFTTELAIDNSPPVLADILWFESDNNPVNIGSTASFTLRITSTTSAGPVTLDLTAIGYSAAETMDFDGIDTYTWGQAPVLYTQAADQEYTDYVFKARVYDSNNNLAFAESAQFNIDCQPISFSADGIEISQTNGDNPVANVANINDVLTVYASAAAYLDAVSIQATIGSGTVDFATATMVYNSAMNRHEATFVVSAPGVSNWGINNGNTLYYKLTAEDDAANISTMVQGNSTFTVRNERPTMVATTDLNPNYDLNTAYNLGTSTVGDLLHVDAYLSGDTTMNRAWIDFSDCGSGTVEMAVAASSATTIAGIPVSSLPPINGETREIYVIGQDEGGNKDFATFTYTIDNVAPQIVSAEFDGTTIRVNLSEVYENASIDMSKWTLVGSASAPLGTPAYLNFAANVPDTTNLYSFDITLDAAQQITVGNWASTPVYLQITNSGASPLTDLFANELPTAAFYPVTITDSSWRELPEVSQVAMTQNWPAATVIDIYFNKEVEPTTLSASSGVLLYKNLTYDYSSVDYADGYVFTPSDTISWPDALNNHVRITLNASGTDWIARKIGTANTLKFAIRDGMSFVKDNLQRSVKAISSQSPMDAADNRPTPAFNFDVVVPELDMASRSLKLTASDRLLLFTNDFTRANSTDPLVNTPVPSLSRRVTGFHNQIILHEYDSGASLVLQLEDLQLPTDNLYASTTISLKLTTTDVDNVINLFQSSATPDWRLQINAGAFTNLWGTNNTAYLPSGNPGPLNMIYPVGYNAATVAACSMSDKPPVNQKAINELAFEVEIFPPNLDGAPVPIQTQAQPAAQIKRQDNDAVICNGSFISYSNRTVDGLERTVARFTNAAAFPAGLQRVPVYVEVTNIRDIFDTAYVVTASQAYDLNLKSDSAPGGFTDTASVTIELDTQKPSVVQVIPGDYIGRLPYGSEFRVEFSEAMDPNVIPTLRLATGTTTMSFTFSYWIASETAVFTNNTAFTEATANGVWTWEVTGGRDEATNSFDTTFTDPVEVRTYAPEVSSGNVSVRTVQPTVDVTATLIDQPWSRDLGDATFQIVYSTDTVQHWPHVLEVYDAANTRYGQVAISVPVSRVATATFTNADFDPLFDPGVSGPTDYKIRIIDSAMNQTDQVATLTYDNLAPDVTSITMTGIGSETTNISYYNPMIGAFNLNATTGISSDELKLAIYSVTDNATTTYDMTQTSLRNYNVSTGNMLAEGAYILSIIDRAGNIGTGLAQRGLIVDKSNPTVLSVVPDTLIGNSPADGTTFTVIFSEPMDAGIEPTLTLATAGTTITMNFAGWADANLASTAYYTNAIEIETSMPSGFYNYDIVGGKDLAGNILIAPSAGTFKVEVMTDGPFAQISHLTDQSAVYGVADGIKTNYAFNGVGSATINITYPAGPFNTPHRLNVYDKDDVLVSSSGAVLNNINEQLIFPNDFNLTDPLYTYTDQTYSFKLIDDEDNVSGSALASSLKYDATAPDVATITISGLGTFSTGAYYYSPNQGDVQFTVETNNDETLKFVFLSPAVSPVATQAIDLETTDARTHVATFGSTLVDDVYIIGAVDTAGNIGNNATLLIVDSDAPTVSSATPLIAGGHAAGTGVFVIEFDEAMNRSVTPTANIASTSTTIPLTFTSWIDATHCQFTNTNDLTLYNTGSYSYQITGARDLAGNENENPLIGSFTIDLYTQSPLVTAVLYSQQPMVSADIRMNEPFSLNVAPGVATLTLYYNEAPTQIPHMLWIYDNDDNLTASITFTPDVGNKIASITVDANFFDNIDATPGDEPGNNGPLSYKFKLVDQIGNISATNSTIITYDALAPVIDSAAIGPVSDGSNDPLYYNEALYGPLYLKFGSTATDSLRLVIAGNNATNTYSLNLDDAADEYSASLTTSQASALATGTYTITAVDLAGNFATGASATTVLIIDRQAPTVTGVVSLNGEPLTSEPIGGATFTVTFNESMKASATPLLSIATGSTVIGCAFDSWLDAPAYTQAQFVTTSEITPDLPQGEYEYRVTGWDLTGNKLDNAVVGTVVVQSRGPVIATIFAESMQATTASGTEILRDTPFSFAVAPNAATLTVTLSQDPDALPINLHFMQSGVTVASYPLTYDAVSKSATFTWSLTNGPVPTIYPTTYQIKLVDDSGDFSLESYDWTVDASAPVALDLPTVTRGAVATDSVYFNPSRQSYLNVSFNSVDTDALRMRIRGANSTDTYALNAAGANTWAGNFDGRYSRGTDPKPLMPDGIYSLDLVDQAGNVGLLASGDPILYNIIIDTVEPAVSTYSTYVNGNPVTAYSPAAGNLEIRVESTDTLSESGIFWVDVLNSSNIKIKQLPLTDSGAYFSAFWDGTNSAGSTVLDGTYSFRATDYAGNPANISISIFALTTPFKVVGAVQISSSTAKLVFNHEVDANLAGAAITAAGLTISNIQKIEAQAVSFSVTPNFAHQATYEFQATPGTISSIYGAGIAAPNNTAPMLADGQGPVLSSVNFSGLSGQQEFKVVFDESYKPATAGDIGKYSLTGPSGALAIAAATTQADTKTVLLTAASNLIENADYQISVTGIEDVYGNLSPSPNSINFKGRDLTPPVLEVSAFSNPANESDIIVVVVSNEDLKAPPVLQIAQSNAPVITTNMQQGANSRSFMIGVHLSPSYPGNGTLVATAQDLAGNQGSGNSTFAVAYLSANKVASVKSADEKLVAEFSTGSLKDNAMFKIMGHRLEAGNETSTSIRTALQQQARLALGLRASQTQASAIDQTELKPVSMAYEVAIAAEKVKEGFNVFVEIPQATSTTGLGLFYQTNDQWKFLTAKPTRGSSFAAKAASTQLFAILRDVKGPEVALAADIDLNEPFRTPRPEFRGKITDAGSGLDITTVTAHIDSGPAQNVTVDNSGNFTFKPMADLTGGWHDLVIRAKDNTGNDSAMTAVRFEVVVPLQITQIAQYPNPARVRTFIRISANRGDVSEDLVKVKIYDVAGHRVATLDGIKPVNEKWGINARYLYDIPWDLRNASGKLVANGVYFARIEIKDPDNPSKKVKETFKIAILR